MDTIKDEVINLLVPIFGAGIKDMVEKYFDADNPQELIDMAHELLAKFMGNKNTDKEINEIIKKFKINVRLY